MGCYYEGLLRLCGFENDEIEREKPRIDKALQRLRLGPGDIKAKGTDRPGLGQG